MEFFNTLLYVYELLTIHLKGEDIRPKGPGKGEPSSLDYRAVLIPVPELKLKPISRPEVFSCWA